MEIIFSWILESVAGLVARLVLTNFTTLQTKVVSNKLAMFSDAEDAASTMLLG